VEVSGIGWVDNLGLVKTKREAIRIVQEAFDKGITFMDNAWEYHDGLSEQIMGQGLLVVGIIVSDDGPPGRKQHGFPPLEDLAA